MFKSIFNAIGGDPNTKAIAGYSEIVDQINALEGRYEALSNEALAAKTAAFKARLAEGESLDDLLAEAFATVREVSKRTLGMRHYDVQLIGGIILHEGQVAEMRTGEGKTLMSTLALYLNALTGKGVHLITVNDYLARRDARWMTPVFDFLGLSVGVLQMGSRMEGGKKGYLVDLNVEHAQEDQHQLVLVERTESYAADITYGTNNEFGFDYLRDNMTLSLAGRAQRGHHFAIIDEVDNVLIDEARTPLIISGPSYDDAENYENMAKVVKQLNAVDFEVAEKDRTVTLTEIGEVHVEQILGVPLGDPERPEDATPEQARTLGYLEQGLRAEYLYRRNKDYLVQGGKVIIIDEFTGRLMPGRRWSDGLHQAVEAKEGVKVEAENVTHATITIQNYFRMYEKLSGMTGTALTEGEEFHDIYKLEVLAIPPNVEFNAMGPDAPLITLEAKDEYGYEYTYYAERDDEQREPVFWKRKDYPDVIYRSEEAKLRAIVQEIMRISTIGRPILVGTTSVENSDRLSTRLQQQWVRKLAQALLLRSYWMEQNGREEDGRMIMALSFLYEPLENLSSNQLNQMAKDLGMNLTPDSDENVERLLYVFDLQAEHRERLVKILNNGIPHQVLNARRHTEESQIIAGAGAFGAVTIATNMAGRGVDIKLGGEMAEEVLSAVNRVLRRSGVEEPYEMSMEERLDAVHQLSDEDRGIYKSEIDYFIQSIDEMEKVKELGGLHVIGSERHDARRIDNQLRGRAARQGDPGSSRFYLSLQDDLMRLFGGQQVDGLMQRFQMDDALPLEHRMVSSVVEQSQTRVEGANFDARKHLLEYDDVLNSQRETIYAQRDRVFTKEDLSDDIHDFLEHEVGERIQAFANDDDAAWKLLAWLEQVQPTQIMGNVFVPSFMYKLLLDELTLKANDKASTSAALVEIAEGSIHAEEAHVRSATDEILASNEVWLDEQLEERLEALDTFTEALRYSDETDARSPKELFDEAQTVVRLPLSMSKNDQRLLRDDPDAAAESLTTQVEEQLTQQAAIRVIGAVERRLNASLELNARELGNAEWEALSQTVYDAVEAYFTGQRESLLGRDKLEAELDNALDRIEGEDYHVGHLLQLLLGMQQGTRIGFNPRTRRKEERRYMRFRYFFHAAKLLENYKQADLQAQVLKHLQHALGEMKRGWGAISQQQGGATPLAILPKPTRKKLEDALGAEAWAAKKGKSLSDLDFVEDAQALAIIGEYQLTEAHRQVLLRSISEMWIEYLTKMEALRVSIGLEAYGQRDPLVQYKAQASKMFAELIRDIRAQVVNRMFNIQPSAAQPTGAPQPGTPPQAQAAAQARSSNGDVEQAKPAKKTQEKKGKRSKKRRRHG